MSIKLLFTQYMAILIYLFNEDIFIGLFIIQIRERKIT
jgi:hypothetical protein